MGLNLSAPKGDLDYSYNNYFIARNYTPFNINTPKWIFPYQQIMMSDGGFKMNTEAAQRQIGWSDDWVAAINGTFDIPKSINPLSGTSSQDTIKSICRCWHLCTSLAGRG